MANEIDINKLRELHAATTQGEWTDGDSIVWLDNTDDDDFVSDCSLGYFSEERQAANATFIAAAHNVMPALLDELERLRAENAALKGTPNE
jgi:hypothetical protein